MSISSSSSKRGLLRPAHSNRISVFVILTVILLTSLFIYNLYASSSTRTELQNIIDSLREKTQTCFKDKLEIEEKLETVTNICKRKSSKMDEKFKDLQSSNKNAQSQLSNVRSESESLRTELDKIKSLLLGAQNSVSDQKRQFDVLKLEKQNLEARIKELIIQNKQLTGSKQRLVIEMSRIKEKGILHYELLINRVIRIFYRYCRSAPCEVMKTIKD
uniref:Uncharacterized protein n=1 Tax=Romanomermis culicivorax TaxID=13658 RepID=A0A915L5S2_ROMCU